MENELFLKISDSFQFSFIKGFINKSLSWDLFG